MLKRKDYPQLTRSQLNIIEALLELLERDKIENISITKIIYESGVARRTFYSYFKSKEEVLRVFTESIMLNLNMHIQKNEYKNIEDVVYEMFKFMMGYMDYLKILEKNNLLSLIQDFKKQWFSITSVDLSKLYGKSLKGVDRNQLDFTYAYHAAGTVELLRTWIHKGCTHSPEEMSNAYMKIVS